MKVLLTGGSGLIGSGLVQALTAGGHGVVLLSRHGDASAAVPRYAWDARAGDPLPPAARGCDAVISLAGENVAQRWTPGVRQLIRDSRIAGTRSLVEALAHSPPPWPRIFVSASATGFYGDCGDAQLSESSAAGSGFLADVCRDWEIAADAAGGLGMRVVKLRIGVVLDPRGGALAKMLPAFRLALGGPLGAGLQWMPWIHHQDLIGLLLTTLEKDLAGVYNACAPQPVRNQDFTRALGAALRRPAHLRVPAFALRAIFGEMAWILLASQRVLPAATLAAGFQFQHPEIGAALRHLLPGRLA